MSEIKFSAGPMPKVFGIGLNKTGTSSLGEALNLLGIKTIHYPRDDVTYTQLTRGDLRLHILETYQGIVDTPIVPFYQQLSQLYPSSKFILTVREQSSWLKSVESHWQFTREWHRRDQQFERFQNYVAAAVYGVLEFDAQRFAHVYDVHLQNVMDFFAGKAGDLLMMDICKGDGWEKLCPFLGVDPPTVDFPHANRKEEKLDLWQWIRQLDRATQELATLVDANAPLALVDDAALAGSPLAARAVGFLHRDGIYYGPPAADAQAIAETERLRASGIEYLVIAWPSFWWLEHYQKFHRHLQHNASCLHHNDNLAVFHLRRLRQKRFNDDTNLVRAPLLGR